MKVVFMGTPDFSVPVLAEILKAGHEVGYVVTQPDKAKNRGKKVQFTPVKELATAHGIKVLQPEKIKQDGEVLQTLKDYAPDIIVVVAYGQIIQKEILDVGADVICLQEVNMAVSTFTRLFCRNFAVHRRFSMRFCRERQKPA